MLGRADCILAGRIVADSGGNVLRNVTWKQRMVDMEEQRQDIDKISLPGREVVPHAAEPVAIDSQKSVFEAAVARSAPFAALRRSFHA